MADLELRRIIEAVLFAADAPVPIERIVEIVGGPDGLLKTGRAQVADALRDLGMEYDDASRAVTISKVAGGWQFYCRPEYERFARHLHKGRIPHRLSQAALETLAIVAYKQPLVRAEIESIRGVDSSGVLATLLKRNLVTIAGRAPGMGRALMYRTTNEFLRYFGLNDITDLPRLEEFAEVLGLKPGDLEMTIEGAEHVSDIPIEGTEYVSDISAEDNEHAPDISAEDNEHAPEVPVDDTERVPVGAPAENVLTTPDGPAVVRNETYGPHAVGDRTLLERIDET